MKNIFKKKQFHPQKKILNIALLTFSIGLTIIISVGLIFSLIPQMQKIAFNIFASRNYSLLFSIVWIGVFIAMYFFANKLSVLNLIFLYIIFSFVQGFSISAIFINFIFKEETWKIFICLFIPAITMIIMGFIGYLEIFDFSKISRFLFFSFWAIFIFSIVMIFMPRIKIFWVIYSAVGYLLFTLYVGFDLWRISKYEKELQYENLSNDEVIKTGIIFGMRLQIEFLQLVWYLYNIISD